MVTMESTPNLRQGTLTTLLAATILAVSLLFSSPLRAQSLDGAKAAGQIVEQANGMLAACPGAPASVSGLVESINAKRLQQYQDIASKTGATITQVQARAGAKLRQSSPGGCK
ncbi:MAG: YdbL family protein [Rhodospirillales bacterium]|nr:YdbL family protein [Rhodospirillales bacterium]